MGPTLQREHRLKHRQQSDRRGRGEEGGRRWEEGRGETGQEEQSEEAGGPLCSTSRSSSPRPPALSSPLRRSRSENGRPEGLSGGRTMTREQGGGGEGGGGGGGGEGE
eukprot:595388-Pyramimonas_sp.AAC.1